MSYDYDEEQRQLKDNVKQMEADIARGEEITAKLAAWNAE